MTTVAEVQKYLNILGYKKGGGGGVTFPITLAQGGLGQANTAALGAVPYSTATSIALSAASTKLGQYFRSGVAGIPTWSTLTLPDTIGINNLFVASAANVVGTIGSTNSSIFYTGVTGVPAWSNAATVDVNGNFVTTGGLVETGTLYLVPVTGFAITLAVGNHLTSLNPAGTLATGTITMPTTPGNGQRLKVATTQTITALTVNANTGQSILAAPTTLLAGDSFEYIYNLSLTTWYPYEGTGQELPSATLLGNSLGTPGGAVPIQLGTGLSFTGNVLNAIGGGGSVAIAGDTGSVTGSSLTLHAASTAGSSFSFSGSGTALTLNTTDGSSNTILGLGAGNTSLTGSNNAGFGRFTLFALTSGLSNVALGSNALNGLTTGSRNIAVGNLAGTNYTTESNNIVISSGGVAADANTLRISATGTGAGQISRAFVGGIYGVTPVSTPRLVAVGSTDQLGGLIIGTNLSITGNTLNAAGGGSSPFSAGAGTGSAIGGDGTATAAGNYAFSFGNTSTAAAGLNAFAMGNATSAAANYSFAFGNAASVGAGSTGSVAMGASATVAASASSSYVFGGLASTLGTRSYVFGYQAQVNANDGFAFGRGAAVGNSGSWVAADGTNNVVPDSLGNQWNSTFTNGFNFYTGSVGGSSVIGLAASIDPTGTFIIGQGKAETSISYQTPSTGFSITIPRNAPSLMLTPAGTLASGTITLPASAINGERHKVSTTQTITALSVVGSGADVVAIAPTTLLAGNSFELAYNIVNHTWYPYNGSFVSALNPASNAVINVQAATAAAIVGTYANGTAGVGATLTWAATGVQLVDGVTPQVGLSYFVKNQASALQNGVYVCTVVGATGVNQVFQRASNYNTPSLIASNAVIQVLGGSTNYINKYVLPNLLSITIGTTGLTYANSLYLNTSAVGVPGIMYQAIGNSNASVLTGVAGGILTSPTTTTFAFSTTLPAGLTIPQPVIQGITNGSSPAVGQIGEYYDLVLVAPGNSIANGTPADIYSKALTAGIWKVGGNATFTNPTGASSYAQAWVNNASASSTGVELLMQSTSFGTAGNNGLIAPTRIFNSATPFTVYLSVLSGFAGTLSCCGSLHIERIA